jgi:hypothetical protein
MGRRGRIQCAHLIERRRRPSQINLAPVSKNVKGRDYAQHFRFHNQSPALPNCGRRHHCNYRHSCGRCPATPPGMRIRTERFDGLRLACKRRNSQLVEESVRQRLVERHRRVAPPVATVAGNLPGRVGGHSASDRLAVDNRASLPVLELHGPQPMADSRVDVDERARCLRELEVSLPSREVDSVKIGVKALNPLASQFRSHNNS